MKKSYFAAVLAVFLLSACAPSSNSGEPDQSGPSVAPVDSMAPSDVAESEGPERSDRGNLIKTVGQTAGMTNAEGKEVVDFSVDKIITDYECTAAYAEPAKHGQFIALRVSVETYPELNTMPFPAFTVNPSMWKFIAPNGTTFNGNLGTPSAYGCLPETKSLPQQIGPAEKATGLVVLDVPSDAGTLVLARAGEDVWEWKIGEKQKTGLDS